jgi:hypothetical protein
VLWGHPMDPTSGDTASLYMSLMLLLLLLLLPSMT